MRNARAHDAFPLHVVEMGAARRSPLTRIWAALGARVSFVPPQPSSRQLRLLTTRADVRFVYRPSPFADQFDASTCKGPPAITIEIHGATQADGQFLPDAILQARGGILFPNGEADDPPVVAPGQPALYGIALRATLEALSLWDAVADGSSPMAVVDAASAVAGFAQQLIAEYRHTRVIPPRLGGLHWSGDSAVVACRDGFVSASSAGDPTTLHAWCASDRHDLPAIDRGLPILQKRATADSLFAAIQRWTNGQSAEHLAEQAQLRRLPFAPVRHVRRVRHDRQLVARGYFDSLAPLVTCPAPTERATGRSVQPRAMVVLDFTHHLAGPLATSLLVERGAHVVHVVAPGTPTRHSHPVFTELAQGKRVVEIDLHSEAGRTYAQALAAQSDLVIDNFSPRVLPNFGLTPQRLRRDAPHLVTLALSAFGASGPQRDYVAYAPTLHAMSGFTDAMRSSHGAPVGWGISFSDYVGGYWAAILALASWHRARTVHEGGSLDISQFERLVDVLRPEVERAARSVRSPKHAPAYVLPCRPEGNRQRWCAVVIESAGQRNSIRQWIAATRPAGARLTEAELTALREWSATKDAAELCETFRQSGLLAALVADAADLVARAAREDR